MPRRDAPTALLATVGAKIRGARIKNGWTLKEISTMTGFSHGQLSDIENGRVNVTIETLARVALALEVPMTSLIDIDLRKLAVGVLVYRGGA
jgi:transcriptional regulator with XRE-family HTH domain